MMYPRKCFSRFMNISKCRYSVRISMLFLMLMSFVFQGCVIHSHGTYDQHTKNKTYTNKNYQRHKDTHDQKPVPTIVKKIPPRETQHPSHTHQPPSHARAYEVAKGKPFTQSEHPSSHSQGHKANIGKPDMGKNHPSAHGQSHKADKEKPLWGDDHPSSRGLGQSMNKDKQDKKGSQGKRKRENTFTGSPEPKNISEQTFSVLEEDIQEEDFQEENIQIAKVERGNSKGKSQKAGKANKMDRGKGKQKNNMKTPATTPKPTPSVTSSEPVTTASFTPAVFDNHQRSIIQSYYQKSGSKKRGKGRGKKSRESKRNKVSPVSKNDILTQPTESLPQGLESQLPPLPRNTKRVLYNQQVLLMERGTNRVLDVINVNN